VVFNRGGLSCVSDLRVQQLKKYDLTGVVCAEEKTATVKTEEPVPAEEQKPAAAGGGATRRAGPAAAANPLDFSTMMNVRS
jgi:hypothetical protein